MEEKKSSVAWQVFCGLFLFFVVLPIATCAMCGTCGVAAVTSQAPSASTAVPPAPGASTAVGAVAPPGAAGVKEQADAPTLPHFLGVIPKSFQAAAQKAFGATAVATEDGELNVRSRRCKRAAVDRVVNEWAKVQLIEAGFLMFYCLRSDDDFESVELLSWDGGKRHHAARTMAEEIRKRGRWTVEEVGVADNDGVTLFLVSRECSLPMIRDTFPSDGRRLLRDSGGFIAIRCDGGPHGRVTLSLLDEN